MKVNLSGGTPFSKTCDNFLGGFRGAKIVKSKKKNLKNIHKHGKNILNNKFTENFHMYFKQQKYIFLMPHLFERPVIIFGWFWGCKNPKN